MDAFNRGSIIAIFAVSIVIAVLVKWIVVYRRLSHFHGPPLAAWTDLWHARQILARRNPYAQMEGLAKYGSFLRIAPKVVVTDDGDFWRYVTSARSTWSKGPWYEGNNFGAEVHSIFSERNVKVHAEKRAIQIGAYHMKDVTTVEADTDEVLTKLIYLLEQKYRNRKCDLSHMTTWFTMDVLSKIAYGESFGFLDADEDLWQHCTLFGKLFSPLELILNVPFLRDFLLWRPVERMLAPKPTDEFGVGQVIRFSQERIRERFERDPKGVEKRDFLGHFIRKGLTQPEAEAESRLQIIAGSDSTSSAIRNTLNLILTNSRVLTRLRTEIDSAVVSGEVSSPIIQNHEAQKLEYLQACMWEGLRMFPPLFGLLGKSPPPGGDTWKGLYFPEDCQVSLCMQAVCRRRDIYGKDIDVFRPERWLDPDPAIRQKMLQNTELVFGIGRYQCLGRNISFMEQGKFLVEMLRRFDWAMADPYKGSSIYPAALWVQKDMNYYVEPRSQFVSG